MKPGRAVASFDSTTGLLRGLSRYLAGSDAPLLGQLPRALEPVMSALMTGVNRLPHQMADRVYAASGISEAIPMRRLGEVNSDELAGWIAGHYPERRYPVIFLGSTNGAAAHLAAALDAPWLPQTVLLPVRRKGVDRDSPRAEMAACRDAGRALLDANPELGLHHMHDPNQDRLMIAGMSYFRVKWLRLPEAYRRFIRERLAPGGVVVSVECDLQWPVTDVSARHHFQFGALGGATVDEYHCGGPRVADLLRRYGAPRRRWNPPPWDQYRPEAEWGFDPSWLADLEEAVEGPLHRLRFDHPERISPVVADVYRAWYEQHGIPDERLLFDCFLLVEPWWTIRTGSVPFWLVFNSDNSLRAAHSYLDAAGVPDEVRLMLFSHGTESIGLAPIHDWEELVARARKIGAFVGVDTKAFPRDFAVFARAHRELTRTHHLYPRPDPMSWEAAAKLMRRHADRTFSVEP